MAEVLLIAARIPEFAEKSPAWFRRNLRNIQHGRIQNTFWQRNTFVVTKTWNSGLRGLVEQLIETGYALALFPEARGEFSLRGGTLILFPINEEKRWRIDFFGNTIETIEPLRGTRNELKKIKTFREHSLFEYLRSGDFVVHRDHGIGIWRGVVNPSTTLWARDYFLIEYRGPRGGNADTLHVPVSEAKRITPYIGFRVPAVTRLGTPMWQRTIGRTREDAVEFAKKLLATHAARALASRAPLEPYPELESVLIARFPHKETISQKRVFEEVARDLESKTPMDRIVVGDVGFGKTEVALRASVRVAAAGKQVAILAPTTLLAAQHFDVWKERFVELPLTVRCLSRLESDATVKKILTEIAKGDADIVIGTHRVLSRDVAWKNLGLLVIDEEQRFGVRAKEHLKELKKDIDVLTLSATPLPRTLSLALSHIRRMSVLEEAPVGRIAPETFVLPYKEEIIKHAIERELERHGQLYYIEARIRTIPRTLERIRALLPKHRVGYIHGRMDERVLVETMRQFRAREIEILVSTTIIENGIDLRDVNTLIVSDATRYGLAELHQLRGRIGRGREESYAYFFYEPERLAPKAAWRLDVLASTQFLGAGSIIAERDLEMRGAGNILGREQSGAASHVGLNLYSQFLAEAVEKLRGGN